MVGGRPVDPWGLSGFHLNTQPRPRFDPWHSKSGAFAVDSTFGILDAIAFSASALDIAESNVPAIAA
jgi:hypothetical protein